MLLFLLQIYLNMQIHCLKTLDVIFAWDAFIETEW